MLVQLALVGRRSVSMSSGLSAAVLLVLAWDPAAPLSASFWLSFIAVTLLWQLARLGNIRARAGAAEPAATLLER